MGTNCAVFLAHFYRFTFLIFLECLIMSCACLVFLSMLCLLNRLIEDAFIPDIPDFTNFV
jgi:hypothetical protein